MTNYERDFTLAIANRNADLLRSLVTSVSEAGEIVDPAFLIVATKAACTKCIRVLLENGIDVNTTDPVGNTALYWAVTMNNLPIADLLLQAGVRASLANERGESAITQAELWHRSEMTDLFRDHGDFSDPPE